MALPEQPHTDTSFAAAAREARATLRAQRSAFLANATATSLLEAMPAPAFVLNRRRQIVAANARALEWVGAAVPEALIGSRMGEALSCVHAEERSHGCGTTRSCRSCGALRAVLDGLAGRAGVARDCRLITNRQADGGALDLRVWATPIAIEQHELVVVGLEDRGDARRRLALERTMFDHVLATCRELHELAHGLRAEDLDVTREGSRRRELRRLTSLAVDQIEGQRQLLAAERGTLAPRIEDVDLAWLLEDAVSALENRADLAGRAVVLECPRGLSLRTDPDVLGRVVGLLLANALEATPEGGGVSLTGECEGGFATIAIRNEGEIPEPVQEQIFQRSFSTSGDAGRGLGTYAARLLVERGLGGRLAFVSSERTGTVFAIVLPRQAAPPLAA